MALWFITEAGERRRLLDPFRPMIFVEEPAGLGPSARGRWRRTVAALDGLSEAGPVERLDFWTGRPRRVQAVAVTDLNAYALNLRRLARAHPELIFYNADIPPEILYGYHTGLFPLARCAVTFERDRLLGCRLQDDPLTTEDEPPPLRQAELRAEGTFFDRRPRLRALSLTFEGRTLRWEEAAPEEGLASLRAALGEIDPDLIWTEGGDSTLMPALFDLAARLRIEDLGLDREPGVRRRLQLEGRSYVSYGRVLYQAPDYPLYGRWHIDRRNCFWAQESGLEGLIEVARLSKIPIQRIARRSIGTGISSIQLAEAYRRGYLIPWKKSRPEAWKTAATLLKSDRGGLVYQPLVGVYEDVIELDFVSMYPAIMVRRNVSPETVNCACCRPRPIVPEIGYSLCRRRRGLVSDVLGPIIAKRAEYKRRRQAARAAGRDDLQARLDGRQGALKWLLVCCFGYLGYRNARFGRIEAHEATCAFSRRMLVRAREVCEARGFRFLHGIVDCVWLSKPGAAEAEVTALIEAINRRTGLTIALEGRYSWIVFLPSRQHPELPVPNRYFGRFEDGTLKFRGIEVRRSDQAPYVRRVQAELLERLREAPTLAACRALGPALRAIVEAAEARLRARQAPAEELLLRRATSREAGEYVGNAMTAVAARQAAAAGLPLHAGEAVSFLVLNARDRHPASRLRIVQLLRPEDAYDVEFYVEQLRRAAATILEPLLTPSPAASVESPRRRRRLQPPECPGVAPRQLRLTFQPDSLKPEVPGDGALQGRA